MAACRENGNYPATGEQAAGFNINNTKSILNLKVQVAGTPVKDEGIQNTSLEDNCYLRGFVDFARPRKGTRKTG